MAQYIIGDVQGCYKAFKTLLKAIEFDPENDHIIFCGDLVNRGGESLKMLNWAYEHRKCCDSVFGNHDLSLLAHYHCPGIRKNHHEFDEILSSDQCDEMMAWLLSRPMIIELKQCWVVHAGFYPLWNPKKWHKHANRVTKALKKDPIAFFQNMYGNKPSHWDKVKSKQDKLRFTVNAMTRMRYLDPKTSALNLKEKGTLRDNAKLMPWFRHPRFTQTEKTVVFGHWSALGLYQDNNVICLDTGKVWGGMLTALRLDDGLLFQV